MRRVHQIPRLDWRDRLEWLGFTFHSIDPMGVDLSKSTEKFAYWREDVAYQFSADQIDALESAGAEVHALCLGLVDDLVTRGDLGRLHLNPIGQQLVEQSWRRQDPALLGRFDFAWDGVIGAPKMLEYNADTPTSLIESSLAQWYWKQDVIKARDQFNSLHEALVDRWRFLRLAHGVARVHFAVCTDSHEDYENVDYLASTAAEAGLTHVLIDVEEIGLMREGEPAFVDMDSEPIEHCFKLYPWEWMIAEDFGQHVATATTRWIEPPWKLVLSNKAMLPLLWARHEGHPNLLPAFFSEAEIRTRAFDYVKKPVFSREGANVSLMRQGRPVMQTPGAYDGPCIYQAHAPVATFQAPETTSIHGAQPAVHAVLGVWMIGDTPHGLCVREDISPVTRDSAYFVPHYF